MKWFRDRHELEPLPEEIEGGGVVVVVSVGKSLFEYARVAAIKKVILATGHAPVEQRGDLIQRARKELEADGLAA